MRNRIGYVFAGFRLVAMMGIALYSSPVAWAQDTAPAPQPPAAQPQLPAPPQTPPAEQTQTPVPPQAPPAEAPPAPVAQPTSDFTAIMKTEHLMEFFLEDTQKTLSAAMKAEPQNARGWKDIKRRADAFADLSNLVLLRTEYPDTAAWREKALAMRAAALDLAGAADAKNFAQSQEKYSALITSCNACHQKFEPDTATTIEP